MEDRHGAALFLPSLARHPVAALTHVCQSESVPKSLKCDHSQIHLQVGLWYAALQNIFRSFIVNKSVPQVHNEKKNKQIQYTL